MTSLDASTAPATGRPGVLDRALSVRIRLSPVTVTYLVILGLAFAVRFWDLGARALGHDESIHADWSWDLLRADYRHNPIFHGPLYYHAQGLVFLVFGATDYTSRVSAAIFGTGMVALPLLLRRRLGTSGTIAAMALLTISPTIVYYSRHIREDIYMAFFTLVMVVGMWRYIEEGRDRWLLVFTAGFVGSLATKEATYLTAAVFLLYLNGYVAAQLARRTLSARGMDMAWRRTVLAIGLFPFAWALVAIWPFVGRIRASADWGAALPRSGDVLVLLGTITVPTLTPFLKGPLESIGVLEAGQLDWDSVCRGGGAARDSLALAGLFAITVSAAALVGLQWRPVTWAVCFGAGTAAYLTLSTTLWTNLDGACTAPWGSLDYWLTQQETQRGNQPWFYYYMVLPVYEFLPLIICAAGAWWSVVRGDAFSRFCWFWLIGTLLALSASGEKMPWLNTHLALPAAILAAWTIARAWQAWDPRPGGRQVAQVLVSIGAVCAGAALLAVYLPGDGLVHIGRLAIVGAAVAFVAYAAKPFGARSARTFMVVGLVAALAPFSVRTMASISFTRLDNPRDLLMYAEIRPAVPEIRGQIDALGAATGRGFELRIAVDSAHTWPWPWYFRDYAKFGTVTYTDMSNGPPDGNWDVLIVNSSNLDAVRNWIARTGTTRYGEPRNFIQLWWPNEDYKRAITTGPFKTRDVGDFHLPYLPEWSTWRHIGTGFKDRGWLATMYEYWRDREPPGGFLRTNAAVFFPANFNPEAGELTVTPLPPPGPGMDDQGRLVLGSFGNLPGQFISPVDIAADEDGNIYVIDSTSKRLQKFDAEGNYLDGIDIRNNPDEASEPWGLTVRDGVVVVADTFGWRVRVFTTGLERVVEIGGQPPTLSGSPGPYELFGPRDAVIDDAGNIWVTDTGHDRIVVYSPEGIYLREFGVEGTGPGEFDEPVGLAFGPDGNVYVADMYNARVQVLDQRGAFVREFPVTGWGGQGASDKPYLTVLEDGRVAVSLPGSNLVRVYAENGAEVAVIGLSSPNLISRPYGIVEGAGGRLWISEGASGRLRLFEISP